MVKLSDKEANLLGVLQIGLTGIRIRIRKLEKIRDRRYQDLNPEELRAFQIIKIEENSLLLRKAQGENVDAELAEVRKSINVDKQLEVLYKLEEKAEKEEAEKDAIIARRMKKGENLLVPE